MVNNAGPESEPIVKNKPLHKTRAKDSDDEDYMSWKKPDPTAPIVTFTPPPDVTPAPSFRYKPNILTKKYLEFLNGRQNVNRPMFADGDDGFESLNGYNSNGSDGDCRQKESDLQNKLKHAKQENPLEGQSSAKLPSMMKDDKIIVDDENVQCANASVPIKEHKDKEDLKSVDPDSDCAITTNPNVRKRIGVRFRKSWTKEPLPHESSDDDFGGVKGKQKVKYNTYKLTEYTLMKSLKCLFIYQ